MSDFKKWRKMACQRMPIIEPILYAVTVQEDSSQPTFCINVKTLELSYNPQFAAGRSDQANAFTLCHEAVHLLCQHPQRKMALAAKEGQHYQPELGVLASEVATNCLVSALTGWAMPKDGVPPFKDCEQLSMEEIYYKAKSLMQKMQGQPCKMEGEPQPGGEPAPGAAAMVVEQAISNAEKQLAEQAKGGKLPGSEVGELRELLLRVSLPAEKLDWRKKLARFLTQLDVECSNFDPRSIFRRGMADRHIVMPNLASKNVAGRAGVSVDNSGSVDNTMFSEIIGVLSDFASKVGFREMLVYHFTSQVIKRERYSNLRQLKSFKRVGDGGTDITEPNVLAGRDKCSFNIIITDGYVNWLDSYSVPTLVVLLADTQDPPAAHNLIGVLRCLPDNKE